jgi:DNA-binding NtrC family response regulator
LTALTALDNDNIGGKQHLLIVDDERDITIVLEMMLNDHYDVDTYTDPIEALTNVEPHKYDLILFDYLMPKMNGFDFYRKVKQIDPDVNTCMMTAYEAVSAADKHSNESIQPFDSKFVLKKPFDLAQILAKFDEILG